MFLPINWEKYRIRYACNYPMCKCQTTRPCPAELTHEEERDAQR